MRARAGPALHALRSLLRPACSRSDLSGNNFDGSIPPSLGLLTALTTLCALRGVPAARAPR